MNRFQTSALIIAVVLLLQTRSFAQAQLKQEKISWYNFHWDGEKKNLKDAMMLHSQIDSLPFNFKWQFDTGSPRSFFYGNVWNSFLKAYPQLGTKFFLIDSVKQDGYVNLNNPSIKVSGNPLPGKRIGFMAGYGDEVDKITLLENQNASTIIGTVGIDIFRQGVLVIDFKNNKLGYSARLKEDFYEKELNTVDFMLYKNRILVPVLVNNKKFYFFYDSGASLFALKTTSAYVSQLPSINYTDTLRNITTWGKSYDVPGGRFKGTVKIGSLKVENPKVYVHPDPEKYHTAIFKEADAYGLLGNAYFDDKIIVIDFTRMKFSIID